MRAPFLATRSTVTRSPEAKEGRHTLRAWAVTLAGLALVGSLVPAGALAADPSPSASPAPSASPVTPPPPLTITPLCATDLDNFWTISSDAPGPANYPGIDYTTRQTEDWTFPNGMQSELTPASSGGHVTLAYASKADGTTLYARWTDFPDQVASTSTAPTAACAMASLTIKRAVQGGAATPDQFPVSIMRGDFTFAGSAIPEPTWTRVTSDGTQPIQPAQWVVGPTKEAGAYLALPAGYFWRSTACATTAGEGTPKPVAGTTTDARYQRLGNIVAPGAAMACTVTYHYGPVLDDTIAAGKVTTGAIGFKTATITVKKGTWVTYLIATSPSLAGKKVQIWTKTGSASKPWKLTKTVAVASDGSVRYYAKVSAFTGFQARWAGDGTYVASAATGRFVKVK